MSDIVDNLSDYIRAGFDPHNQLKEARSEIERLRAEIARLREALDRSDDSIYVEALISDLRAALADKEQKP